jgi:hypothetical protein
VDDHVAHGDGASGSGVEAVRVLGLTALVGLVGCAAPEATAPATSEVSRFSTAEGVQLSETVSPSTVGGGDSSMVTLSLTNPTGSEITVRLMGSGDRAFVVRVGRATALSGLPDSTVPVPARASVVEALVARTSGALPGSYFVRACVVQPGPVESCAAGQPLMVTPP